MTSCEPNYLSVNLANWDARVSVHLQGYDLDRFRADPGFLSKVVQFDQQRLPDINGHNGLHLQCHIGTDTISLARLGAQMTGLDFSPAAIRAAQQLATELNAPVRFVEGEVYRAADALASFDAPQQYDFIFTGIGALCWLPDIRRWANVVATLLKPGGFLFMREGHPMLWSIGDPKPDGSLCLEYDYFEGQSVYMEESLSYTGSGEIASPGNYSFSHGMAEIINAVWATGLRLELFEEHDSVPWNPMGAEFEPVCDTGEFRLKDRPRRLAASYTLLARKPEIVKNGFLASLC